MCVCVCVCVFCLCRGFWGAFAAILGFLFLYCGSFYCCLFCVKCLYIYLHEKTPTYFIIVMATFMSTTASGTVCSPLRKPDIFTFTMVDESMPSCIFQGPLPCDSIHQNVAG